MLLLVEPLEALLFWIFLSAELTSGLSNLSFKLVFRTVTPHSMPPDQVSSSVQFPNGVDLDCFCRQRCIAHPKCQGFGVSDQTRTCQLTLKPPELLNLLPNDGLHTWRWYARREAQPVDTSQPCLSSEDCDARIPGSVCQSGVCTCPPPLEDSGTGTCRKTGNFTPVKSGYLTAPEMSSMKNYDQDTCREYCTERLDCVAFSYSESKKRCAFFSKGITSGKSSAVLEAGSSVLSSFIWEFAAADGTPSAVYRLIDNTHISALEAGKPHQAAHACMKEDGILVTRITEKVRDKFSSDRSTRFIVGLDDIETEGKFVTSDSQEFEKSSSQWKTGEPNGERGENCVTSSADGFIDIECRDSRADPPMCQYVGENLAKNRPSWKNSQNRSSGSAGNDGNLDSSVSIACLDSDCQKRISWSVDLGRPVQVTSVLMASSTNEEISRNIHFSEFRLSDSEEATQDEERSVRCALQKPSVPPGYARLFRCSQPVTGRFLHFLRQGATLTFAELAVYGNRLYRPNRSETYQGVTNGATTGAGAVET